ncbi:hypothetical protein V2J09_004960 [Rumex salicifolius]
MLDPATELAPPPSSPTISSVSSSSDLESASTGSFFHDRSTTLGTLMGVTTFPPSFTFNALTSSQRRRDRAPIPNNAADFAPAEDEDPDEDDNRRKRLPKRRRRWWWGLCGDDVCCGSGGGVVGVGSSKRRSSASLADFLEVERRLGEALYGDGGDHLEGLVSDTRDGERVLFEDGRVLPPLDDSRGIHHDENASNGVGAFRFPVSIGGLCNRGVG